MRENSPGRDPVLERDRSYLDALSVATAQSGPGTLVADAAQWCAVVREAREACPELLRGVWFTERGHSSEVSDFLSAMRRAGAFVACGPRHEHLEMSQAAVTSILAGTSAEFDSEEHAIRELATHLASLRVT